MTGQGSVESSAPDAKPNGEELYRKSPSRQAHIFVTVAMREARRSAKRVVQSHHVA